MVDSNNQDFSNQSPSNCILHICLYELITTNIDFYLLGNISLRHKLVHIENKIHFSICHPFQARQKCESSWVEGQMGLNGKCQNSSLSPDKNQLLKNQKAHDFEK